MLYNFVIIIEGTCLQALVNSCIYIAKLVIIAKYIRKTSKSIYRVSRTLSYNCVGEVHDVLK